MSYAVDDDPPIKSHPASKEYRENYDKLDWGDDETPVDKVRDELTCTRFEELYPSGVCAIGLVNCDFCSIRGKQLP